ncbi:MAG TPA: porin family protein [Telluria sp.]|jgi:hypothetical protein
MKNYLYCVMALGALVSASGARAEDGFYVGAGLAPRGKLTHEADGVRTTSRAQPIRINGGYQINEHLALEAGYTAFGNYHFPSGAEVDLSALHLAMKGSISVSRDFSLFGKVGLAYHTQKFSAAPQDATFHPTRALFGAGLAYRLTDQLSLTAELVNYGSTRRPGTQIKVRQLEAGLQYRF